MSDVGTCRSCGAPMRWVMTEKGKRHPLDIEPTPDGAWWIDEAGVMHYAPEAMAVDGIRQTSTKKRDLYTSHFSTCPNARQHRRKK